MVIAGFIFLRLSGRKSLAQMTVTTTVVMISIGAIIVQPIIDDSVAKTLITIIIFISVLIVIEYIQVKSNVLEKLITGKAIAVIENGKINLDNLKKMRFTVDKLEMQLRQRGISNFSDVKNATIEPNGQLGYELTPDARPLTVGEFKKLTGLMMKNQNQSPDVDGSLFYEVIYKQHSKNHQENLK
nr:DUF421 domain-containing protein [Natronobacillus azotifigens]